MMCGVELTTMCSIVKDDMVLMINRRNNWKGWAFPGGHIENGESMNECIKREIYEETGLIAKEIKYRGIAHFYNTENHTRHIVSNYFCNDFDGILFDKCDEGILRWVKKKDIPNLSLAEGMEYRLPLFFNDKITELFVMWNEKDGYINIVYND